MLPRYISLLFVILAIYMLFSSNYYEILKSYVEDWYLDAVRYFYKNDFGEIVKEDGEILFTASALKKYTNLENGLYLAILGQVFDVTSGAKHYGPGQSYHAFTGCDGSAAFITGDFTKSGLIDDVSSLSNKQIQSLMGWVEFYRKNYMYKGKLIGRYYNEDGSSTNERYILEERIQIAKKQDLNEEKEKEKFPPCNVEWNAETGSRVWCTKNSGGIARNWIGVPRMLYNNPESKQHRCACINLDSKEYEENKGMIRVFKGCDENSTSCNLVVDG